MGLKYANNAKTTLNGAINSSVTTIVVTDGSVFPSLGGSDYFYMTLEDVNLLNEVVKVTARSTNTLTVVRAQDGTTAKAFSTADKAEGRVCAAVLTDLFDITANIKAFLADPTSANLLAAVTDETGTGALVFGTSPSLTTPTIAGGALSGTFSGAHTYSGVVTSSGGLVLTTASNEQLKLWRDGAAIAWYEATGVTRRGYIQHDSGTTLIIRNEVASGAVSIIANNGSLLLDTTASSGFIYTNTDAGAFGAIIKLVHASASPAANDVVGAVNFYGRDSAGNEQLYGYLQSIIVSPTSTTETSYMLLGSTTNSIRIGAGLYFSSGSATTDRGSGTVNAEYLYLANATGNIRHSGTGDFYLDVGQGNGTPPAFYLRSGSAYVSIMSVSGSGRVTAPGGFTTEGGNRSFFSAGGEPYAIGLRYTTSGSYAYIGATNSSSTPGVVISNQAGSSIATFNNDRTTTFDGAITAPAGSAIGLGAGQVYSYVKGGGSGTNDGAAVVLTGAGTTFLAIGNYSSIIGGAWDSRSFYYSIGDALFSRNGTTKILYSSTRTELFGPFYNADTYYTGTATAANVTTDSSGIFMRFTSSLKYKRNVEPLDDAWVELAFTGLDNAAIWYASKCERDNQDHHWPGFAAETLAESVPHLVQYATTERVMEEETFEVQEHDEKTGRMRTVKRTTTTPVNRKLETPVPEGVDYARVGVILTRKIAILERRLEALEKAA